MKNIVRLLIFVLIFASCNEKKSKNTSFKNTNYDKIEAAKQIEELEAQLISTENSAINLGTAQKVVKLYREYAKQLPLDVGTPEYLFKAADVEMGLQHYRKAEALYNRIYKDYSGYSKRVMCLYLTAFINDNHLNQKGKAKEIYEKIIEKHSDNKLAQEAAGAIKLLTLSDAELIDFLQNKNKEN